MQDVEAFLAAAFAIAEQTAGDPELQRSALQELLRLAEEPSQPPPEEDA